MAKLSKEELIAKIDASSLSEDEKISFMEDIADSFEIDNTELETVKAELEKALADVEDIKGKYKARFLSSEEVEEVKEEIKEEEVIEDPEMKEEEVIDVKDIYEEEDKEDEE